jgi:hypothetical protein
MTAIAWVDGASEEKFLRKEFAPDATLFVSAGCWFRYI